jgi:hypothetical protein
MNVICVCGKIFKHKSGLSRHKKDCPNRENVIITEPDEPGNQLVNFDQSDAVSTFSDDVSVLSAHEAEPPKPDTTYSYAYARDIPPKMSVPVTPKSSPVPPFTPASNRQAPAVNSNYGNNNFMNNNMSNNDNQNGCEKLLKQIVILLEKEDCENASNAGKGVLEDRIRYDNFLNYYEPYVRQEQENDLMKKSDLIREKGITPFQMEVYRNESMNAPDKVALEKLYAFYLCGAEYFRYDAKYNERFNKVIPALKIMRDNVDNYRHITSQSDVMQEKMTPKKVFEVQEKTKEELQKKHLVLAARGVVCVVCCVILFNLFNPVQILAMIFVCFVLFAVFVDTDKVKIKLF